MAIGGLVYLVYPGLTTPTAIGFAMMAISAFTWGLYTLNGRLSKNPIGDTAWNFYRSLPLVALMMLVLLVFWPEHFYWSLWGGSLAILSGAITTGLGYILWYSALPQMTRTLASVGQLAVPLLSALGALWLRQEPITWRLMIAAMLMLGGIALVILGMAKHQSIRRNSSLIH